MTQTILRRKSIRLQEYDYSQVGTYFVTICVKDREYLFGKIAHGEMLPSEFGEIVKGCWIQLPQHFSNIQLDGFVVIPNHVHGIIVIIDDMVGAIHESPLRMTIIERRRMLLPKIIGRFKMNSAKKINVKRTTPGYPFGNGIILNTSFEMRNLSIGFENILQ